ncbi:hypothetical protein ABH15_10540 [Methanoculleus taiwanensis]|uniref:N-acetyltransferase domain-containing protein n=1 Tax=Methanoculleus taiwanensis TaxID=1550565 RepID=A0A498H043_9EURY|nr:GNAT family N-acetyltransferase [Methanoculleus taiwanensis]RXE55226.1 hypothetical protein ABH15_10540 [Methanoculleus taiwanensis]
MSKELVVRRMEPREVDIAVAWAEQEGWNPGIHDAECFHAADPRGFFLAELDGEPIGCMSAVVYNDTFAFGGFYIIKPAFRGRGYGSRLFDAAMAHAAGRNIGGDGVVEMQEKYKERSGFTLAYRNIRFEGIGGGGEPPGLVDVADLPFEQVLAYDTAHFPAPRPAFLRAWLSQGDSIGRAVVRDDGTLAGYGVIRTCFNGYKIGPLFADTPADAETIFHGLMAFAPGECVYFDTPEPNTAAVDIARRHGMEQVFETARMYTRSVPDLPLHEIFGVTSFELG